MDVRRKAMFVKIKCRSMGINAGSFAVNPGLRG